MDMHTIQFPDGLRASFCVHDITAMVEHDPDAESGIVEIVNGERKPIPYVLIFLRSGSTWNLGDPKRERLDQLLAAIQGWPVLEDADA
jgi:hypothetical protein